MLILIGGLFKGDVLVIVWVVGIMVVKCISDLILLCY